MYMSQHRVLFSVLAIVAAVTRAPKCAHAAVSADEAKAIAIDAYIYGYSLITTEVTRVQMTSVDNIEGLRGPMGQFINVKRYPPGDYRGVSAPNADTLYSAAWLDVGAEPIVFSHPDMGKRFYLFPMYSLWMPVIDCPSKRTAGDAAATYLLTGPTWKGKVPAGMREIKSPTEYMLILGRTYADGTEKDYEIVNSLQAQYKLVPLSSYGKPYKFVPPPFNPNPGYSLTEKPQAVIEAMDLSTYFNMMAKLMGDVAPPAAEDAPMVAKMAKIGLVPGQAFDMAKLDPAAQDALQDVVKIASEKIFSQKQTSGTRVNNWLVPAAAGAYGTDYLQRALIAAFGWPANLPEDAVYPYAEQDSTGEKLSGANNYTLTFPRGQTPPVDGFWSITMYIDDGGLWFYPNPLNKFTVSMRNNPTFNDDGSLTLYFQHESPGKDKEANWLPAPNGPFTLMLRMYWPKESPPSILPPGKGTWKPPAVTQVRGSSSNAAR
jgi:hypothetical protein